MLWMEDKKSKTPPATAASTKRPGDENGAQKSDKNTSSSALPEDAYARFRCEFRDRPSDRPLNTEEEIDRRQLRSLWDWHKSYSIGWVIGAIGILIYLFVIR